MRVIPLNLREGINARESTEIPVFLLTITHPSDPDTHRLSSDPTQVLTDDPRTYCTTSRGNVFTFIGMQIRLPDEKDGAGAQTELVISNVDRRLVPLVRSTVTPATVKMELVFASQLDAVIATVPLLKTAGCDYDADQLSFALTVDPLTLEQYPAGSFTPSGFPALFAA